MQAIPHCHFGLIGDARHKFMTGDVEVDVCAIVGYLEGIPFGVFGAREERARQANVLA